MHFKKYIKSIGFNYRSFAKLIGTSHRNVEMWARGQRLPRAKDAKKIFIVTNNQVTGSDLYEKQIQRQETDLQRNEVWFQKRINEIFSFRANGKE